MQLETCTNYLNDDRIRGWKFGPIIQVATEYTAANIHG